MIARRFACRTEEKTRHLLRRLKLTLYGGDMQATPKGDAPTITPDAPVRLRVEVYDALASQKGLTTVTSQAERHGIGRQHMSEIRSGNKGVGLALAMRMAADLGTSVEALFGRVS